MTKRQVFGKNSSVLISVGIALAGYPLIRDFAGLLALGRGRPIISQSQLETEVEREAGRLNIRHLRIHARIVDSYDWAYATREKYEQYGFDQYEVVLGRKFQNTSVLSHELFHVADGHCEMPEGQPGTISAIYFMGSYLEYQFWQEPRAVLYQWGLIFPQSP